jgi:hypothetical protein
MEKELSGGETREKAIANKATSLWRLIKPWEVGQSTLCKTIGNSFTTYCLLSHTANHLR